MSYEEKIYALSACKVLKINDVSWFDSSEEGVRRGKRKVDNIIKTTTTIINSPKVKPLSSLRDSMKFMFGLWEFFLDLNGKFIFT